MPYGRPVESEGYRPQERRLFSGKPEIVGERIRPLGPLSDFVVDRMPHLLYDAASSPQRFTDVRATLTHAVEDFFHDPESQRVIDRARFSPATQRVAVLDLMMLKNAIGNSVAVERGLQDVEDGIDKQFPIFEQIDQLIHQIDPERQVMTITYADVIFSNPLSSDPRTFLPLDTVEGQENYWFYEAHRRAESSFRAINDASRAAIQLLATHGAYGIQPAIKALRGVGITTRDEFKARHEGDGDHEATTGRLTPSYAPRTFAEDAIDNISRLHDDMNRFKTFRPYFNSIDSDPSIGGASGQYTASVPGLELLLAGDVLPPERAEYTNGNWPYMSAPEREHILYARQIVSQRLTLDALSYSLEQRRAPGSQYLLSLLYGYNDFIQEFRRRHRKAVEKQVPEYFQGVRGTGGTTSESGFLDIRRQFELIQRPRPARTQDQYGQDRRVA